MKQKPLNRADLRNTGKAKRIKDLRSLDINYRNKKQNQILKQVQYDILFFELLNI